MIDGRKLIVIMFVIVVTIGVVTYGLYLLTRPDDDTNEGVLVPNAAREYEAVSYHLFI